MDVRSGIRLALRRVATAAAERIYLQAGYDITRPIAIRGVLTERCNYRCAYCGCWRMKDYPAEMSLEDWKRALGSMQDWLGAYTIQFSGGEPYLYKHFLSLVTWCHSQGINWGVITNGSALKSEIISRTLAARPLNIDISIDGWDKETHDRVRGVPGSIRTISKGLRLLRRQIDEASLKTVIRLKTTVHSWNIESIPELARTVRAAGAHSIDFTPVRRWTPEVDTILWISPAVHAEALGATVAALKDARAKGLPVETENGLLDAWSSHFGRQRMTPHLSPCRVGFRDFHILPNGDVRMCWHYPVVGNVRSATAKEIWRGELATSQRRTMVGCHKFGSNECALSCLAHRPLSHDVRRGLTLLRERLIPSWNLRSLYGLLGKQRTGQGNRDGATRSQIRS